MPKNKPSIETLITRWMPLWLLLIGFVYRVIWIDHIPAMNGDEGWWGYNALSLANGRDFNSRTPSGNIISRVYLYPLAAIHALFGPSLGVLRSLSVVGGFLSIVLGFYGFRWLFGRQVAVIYAVTCLFYPSRLPTVDLPKIQH